METVEVTMRYNRPLKKIVLLILLVFEKWWGWEAFFFSSQPTALKTILKVLNALFNIIISVVRVMKFRCRITLNQQPPSTPHPTGTFLKLLDKIQQHFFQLGITELCAWFKVKYSNSIPLMYMSCTSMCVAGLSTFENCLAWETKKLLFCSSLYVCIPQIVYQFFLT